MQTVVDATQKETAIDQQQRNCETLICQRHQIILRLLSSAATESTRWRVHEVNCPTTYKEDFLTDIREEVSVHIGVTRIFVVSISDSGADMRIQTHTHTNTVSCGVRNLTYRLV